MASRRPLNRDRLGRFCATTLVVVLPDPLRFPSSQHPRWRLRVFDRCWPWRATRDEALRDAVLSRNATRDDRDRVYLDACANLQQDPPPMSHLSLKCRR